MNKIFRNKNNNNFYYIKELQWTNKAAKVNSKYPTLNPQMFRIKEQLNSLVLIKNLLIFFL